MNRSLCVACVGWFLCLFIVLRLVGPAGAQQRSAPTLVSLSVIQPVGSLLGELTRENNTHLEILDLKTGQVQTLAKDNLKTIRRNVSERTAIDSVGLGNYMAWRIKPLLPQAGAAGKIAQLDGAIAFISLGKNAGLQPGQELVVYRGEAEIKDPDTGKVLGQQRRKIARLEVVEIQELLTKARLTGDLDVKLNIGDIVEPAVVANSVAILPLVNAAGEETALGKRLAEELTTGLVNRGVSVIERRLYDKVRGELQLQQGPGFDSAKAQRVGKLLGAYGVLVGTLSPRDKVVEAQLRFVKVETGQIVAAASQMIRDADGVSDTAGGTNEWVSLFNGKDLSGWKTHPTDTVDWFVRNGMLTAKGDKGILYTDRGDYENFRFRVEAKINDGGNSGQYFRVQYQKAWPNGYEAQINSTHRDPQKTGSLHNRVPIAQMLVPPNTFFTQEVIASGNHLVILVNGKKVVDYVDPKNTYSRGHLGIQYMPGTDLAIRRIEVMELPRDRK